MRLAWLPLAIQLVDSQAAYTHQHGGSWRSEPPLPAPRAEVGVAAHDGKVYVIAGVGPAGPVNTLFIFDTATETWREGTPLPGPPRDHVAAAFLDGKLYAMGGLTHWPGGNVSNVYAYDPAVGQWAQLASLPRARGGLGAAVINGKILAVGGLSGGNAVSDLTEYDPATNRWATLAPMPTPRDHLMVAALHGKLYAIGGRFRDIGALVDASEMYDPATGVWSTQAPLPVPRAGGGAAVLNGLLYVFGGEFDGGVFASNEAYDPTTDTWHAHTPMPTARHGTQGAVVNGRIYVPGGGPEAGFSSSALVHSYFLPPSSPTPVEGKDPGAGPSLPGEEPTSTPAPVSHPVAGENGAVEAKTRKNADTAGGCTTATPESTVPWLGLLLFTRKLFYGFRQARASTRG